MCLGSMSGLVEWAGMQMLVCFIEASSYLYKMEPSLLKCLIPSHLILIALKHWSVWRTLKAPHTGCSIAMNCTYNGFLFQCLASSFSRPSGGFLCSTNVSFHMPKKWFFYGSGSLFTLTSSFCTHCSYHTTSPDFFFFLTTVNIGPWQT